MTDFVKLSKLLFSKHFINLVYTNPYIVYTQHVFFRNIALKQLSVNNFFRENESYLFSTDNWYWNDTKYRSGQLQLILDGYYEFITNYPKTKVIFLCPDVDTFNGYSQYKIPCVLFNRNALLDYNDYFVYNTQKIYDSIYNANFYKYKRHYLIKNINNIGLIYYLRNKNNQIYYIDENEMLYGKNIEEEFKQLNNITLLNIIDGKYKYLSKQDICKYYGQSYSGLILSDIEGMCLASIEYLLSGLPVISSKNKGGRDYFLENEDFAKINVEDENIQYYIDYFKSVNIDRNNIRKITIDKINNHRQNMIKWAKINISNKIQDDLISNLILAQKLYKP